ncbi:hypothetical protein GCM10010346_57410 [Streptomyces chryseus]|uniref:Uncharacterized protein n=1 Tax=Streptomyces chryseus TaxID=68186 RepID=A0ABQ3E7Z7_9ACTN|nr:hypothetical protein GCM10010346_57410 [Streptomyces chryseus]
MSHDEGIRSQVVEEVAVYRHPFNAYDVGQDFGEVPLGVGRRAGVSALGKCRFIRRGRENLDRFFFHANP